MPQETLRLELAMEPSSLSQQVLVPMSEPSSRRSSRILRSLVQCTRVRYTGWRPVLRCDVEHELGVLANAGDIGHVLGSRHGELAGRERKVSTRAGSRNIDLSAWSPNMVWEEALRRVVVSTTLTMWNGQPCMIEEPLRPREMVDPNFSPNDDKQSVRAGHALQSVAMGWFPSSDHLDHCAIHDAQLADICLEAEYACRRLHGVAAAAKADRANNLGGDSSLFGFEPKMAADAVTIAKSNTKQ